jgi:hypothetical protein
MAVDAFIGLLALVGLACFFYGPWQSVCTDWGRQVVFEKRDAIFDLALAGRLDFRSDEYRAIRSALEKSIRFAHYLTLPRLQVIYWALRKQGALERKSELSTAVEAIRDPATRDEVRRLVSQAHMALLIMAAAKSALFVLFAIVVVLFGFAKQQTQRLGRIVSEPIQMGAENSGSESGKTA